MLSTPFLSLFLMGVTMKKNQLIIDLSQYPELETVNREYLESSIYKLLMLIALSEGKHFPLPRIDIQDEPAQYVPVENNPRGVDGVLGRTTQELVKDILDHSSKMEARKSGPVDPNIDSLILLRFLSILHSGPTHFLPTLFFTDDDSFKETMSYWRGTVEQQYDSMSVRQRLLKEVGLINVGDMYFYAHRSAVRFLTVTPLMISDLLAELKEHGFQIAGMWSEDPAAEERWGVKEFIERHLGTTVGNLLTDMSTDQGRASLTQKVLNMCFDDRMAKQEEKTEIDYTKYYPDLVLIRFLHALSRDKEYFMSNMWLGATDFFDRKKDFLNAVDSQTMTKDLQRIGMLEIGLIYRMVFKYHPHEPIDFSNVIRELENGHTLLGDDGMNERVHDFAARFALRNWNYTGSTPVDYLCDRIKTGGGAGVLKVFLENTLQDRVIPSLRPIERKDIKNSNMLAFLSLLKLPYVDFSNNLSIEMALPRNKNVLGLLSKDLSRVLRSNARIKRTPDLFAVVCFRYRKSNTQPCRLQVERAVDELSLLCGETWLADTTRNEIIDSFCASYLAVIGKDIGTKEEALKFIKGQIDFDFDSLFRHANPRLAK